MSSALHLEGGDLRRLVRFDEPVYLHQAVARHADGRLSRFDDLPAALAADVRDVTAWRVHFHLPVFVAHLPDCDTTQDFLGRFLPRLDPDIALEVETYTFDVLPPELRATTVTDSLVREIRWAEAARRRA